MVTAFLISVNQSGPITRASYTPVMVLASAASILAGITSLFLKEHEPRGSEAMNLSEVLSNPDLKRFLGLVFLYHIGSSIDTKPCMTNPVYLVPPSSSGP